MVLITCCRERPAGSNVPAFGRGGWHGRSNPTFLEVQARQGAAARRPCRGRAMGQRIERLTAAEGTKFLIVGGASYVVHAISLFILYEFMFSAADGSLDSWFGEVTLRLFLASAIAVEIAIIARFLMNDAWTFRARRTDSSLVRRF